MKAHIRTERKHAFVVRQDDLQKIWRLLEDRIGVVNASAECSDDMVREFDNWEQLASYDNPPTKQIMELSIKTTSESWKNSVRFSYRPSDSPVSSIDFQVEMAEQVGAEIKDKIYDILDGTKPWYSALTRVDFTGLVPTILFMYLLLYIFYYIIFNLYISNPPAGTLEASPKKGLESYIFIFLLPILLVLGFIVYSITQKLNKLWSWLFPIGYFALGQGKHRYEIAEKIRWGVIIAFVVSLAASVVGLLWR